MAVLDIAPGKLDFIGATLGIPTERRILSTPGDEHAEGTLAKVLAACGGELPTAVFDATGNLHSMNGAFSYVAHGGKLVFVGHTKAQLSIDNPLFHSRESTRAPHARTHARTQTHTEHPSSLRHSTCARVPPHRTHTHTIEPQISSLVRF